MEKTFLTEITIKKVRHLENISIPLDTNKRKHLILTGKNGSGKTSVLKAAVKYIQSFLGECGTSLEHAQMMYNFSKDDFDKLNKFKDSEENRKKNFDAKKKLDFWEAELKKLDSGIILHSTSNTTLKEKYQNGNFIFSFYGAERRFFAETYKNIEKIEFQNKYNITENPGIKFAKYLVDLKATQAFTKDQKKSEKIDKWFHSFENILKDIFEDKNLQLKFDDETFQFSICETNREPFDFNTMSSGYAAIFTIINDLIIRMEARSGLRTKFDMEGIVLIDEIEAHLHLELQRKILPMLVTLFPNIQFIITTHSPFILNSIDNAVIYDLQNMTHVDGGLGNLPYEGIVEGYFKADRLSAELRKKIERYKELVLKDELSDEEYEEIDKLEFYLDEIPDYLAKELTSEYSRLKLEFSRKEQE